MKIGRRASIGANAQENDEEKEHDSRRPVLKTGAPADAPVVQHRKKNRESDAQHQTRQEDGLSRHSIQFERIERWKDVRRKLADGHRFPRAHDEIRKQHHPPGEITDDRRKNLSGVGGLTGSVGKPLHPLAINIAFWKEQATTESKSQNRAERPAAS